MRADAENVATGRGRNSVRITSKDQWADVSGLYCLFSRLSLIVLMSPAPDIQGVYILDLNHMPVGCGTVSDLFTLKLHISLTSLVASILDDSHERLAIRGRD